VGTAAWHREYGMKGWEDRDTKINTYMKVDID
jgi:hypothetical protein